MNKQVPVMFSLIVWAILLLNNLPTARAQCICLPSLLPCSVDADCGTGSVVCASNCSVGPCSCFGGTGVCSAVDPCVQGLCFATCPPTTIATTTAYPDYLLAKLRLILTLLYAASLLFATFIVLSLLHLVSFACSECNRSPARNHHKDHC
ncbi:hypothetical protein CSKR_108115 [Clonorchis sinensis]|uniref:Uncharacterized protein n=2 Tax=Clonorchis sinensis TaxID=79923 RepID=G7YPH8_CLOSI|nr:hypothetical protein CSKR_108115 [Clonorchis sinensis]GAA54859.1 hypothetical protein CLF_105882 [Clonorchis sinensis]